MITPALNLPWQVVPSIRAWPPKIVSAKYKPVAIVGMSRAGMDDLPSEADANAIAAFMVLAANSHEMLVGALRNLVLAAEEYGHFSDTPMPPPVRAALVMAGTALATAGARP